MEADLQEISSKATKSENLIKRNFWFCEQDTKSTLYKATMEYASVVYHQCDIDKLEIMIKDLAPHHKKAWLCTMYKITHNIIHMNKYMYLRPTRETWTRWNTESGIVSLLR